MPQPPEDIRPEPIPIVEERARILTREVETGRVQVRLATEEVEELVQATLAGRRATIERVPMDVELTEPPAVRQEGDVIVVPVVEEVLVVERRLRLREEIRLRLAPTQEEVALPVRRRVQRAEVHRLPPEPEPAPPHAAPTHQENPE